MIVQGQDALSKGDPEAWMPGSREDGPKFTLKNGDQVDAHSTVILYDTLVAIRDVHPRRFESLLALAQGRPSDVPSDDLEYLKEAGLVDQTGAIQADVRSVLISSYKQTPEGPVLIHPVRLESVADRVAVEKVNAELDRRVRKFLQGPDEEGLSRR